MQANMIRTGLLRSIQTSSQRSIAAIPSTPFGSRIPSNATLNRSIALQHSTRPFTAQTAQRSSNDEPRHREIMTGGARGEQFATPHKPDPESPPKHAPAKQTLSSFSLEGKVAVVTGGARGLGLVMSRALLLSGAEVAIVDLNGGLDGANSNVTELLDDIHARNPGIEPPKVTTHYADVSQPSSVDAAMTSILKAHHKVDNLITSAGFTENFAAVDYPFDRLQKLWAVNVDGTYLFAVAVAKHLMQRNAPGSMIFIGSMSGSIVNIPQLQTPYNASKAAVRHLAASLAVEWASAGIRVNCISPGYMLTALTKKILEDKPALKKQWESMIPQGRMGNPDDLMGAVTFLASDASAYVTGANLRVDGGYTLT